MEEIADTIIVGGGPAGLTCALVLGRCRRKVLLFDTGMQRNRMSEAMHAFPSRDGENPKVFLNAVKKELLHYGIRVQKKEVIKACRYGRNFEVTTAAGDVFYSRTLLLATGVKDELPPIRGIENYYGKGVFHCPYCDGYEHRDKTWVVCASRGKVAVELCLKLLTWTSDICLLTQYAKGLSLEEMKLLKRRGIKLIAQPAEEVCGSEGRLTEIRLQHGAVLPCSALIFSAPVKQQSTLAIQLGCLQKRTSKVDSNRLQQTRVEGLYVAGDMAKDMQLVVIAAAEGARAAVAINAKLNKERVARKGNKRL